MKYSGFLLLFFSLVLIGCPGERLSASEVLFDTFRSDNGFSYNYGFFVSDEILIGTQFFVGDLPVNLDRIELPLQADYPAPSIPLAAVRITIRENNAQGEPGAVLDTMERFDIHAPLPGYTANIYSFVPESRPQLAANTAYWLVAEDISANPLVRSFWHLSLLDVRYPVVSFRPNEGVWFHQPLNQPIDPAMRIHGTAVPEPSTLALAALGVLGLLIAARRQR